MDCCTPDLPVHHQLLEFTQTHVYWVGDAIQPSHPLLSPSPPAFNLSQHQSFQMSQFFASGGQSIGISALATDLTMNILEYPNYILHWGLIIFLQISASTMKACENSIYLCGNLQRSNTFPNIKVLLCKNLSVKFLRGTALASCWRLKQCNPLTYLPWNSFIILLAVTCCFLLVFSSISSLSLLLFFFLTCLNSMIFVFPLQGLSSVSLVYWWISVYQSRDSDTYGPWRCVIFPARAPSVTLSASFIQRETPQLGALWWLREVGWREVGWGDGSRGREYMFTYSWFTLSYNRN